MRFSSIAGPLCLIPVLIAPTQAVTVDSVHIQDRTVVYRLRGRYDLNMHHEEFRNGVLLHVDEGRRNIVLNLRGVTYIDESGVSSIVFLLKEIRRRGGQFSLCEVPDQPMAIFRLMRLDKGLRIYLTEAEAVAGR